MSNQNPTINEEEIDLTEIIEPNKTKLHLIQGGKDSTINTVDNWLLKLKVETKFLCKKKKTVAPSSVLDLFAQNEFEVYVKRYFEDTKEWTVLLLAKNDAELFVDPFRFVQYYDLVGVLYEPIE